MSYININNGDFHIFSSGGEYRTARKELFGENSSGPIAPNGESVGTIRFMYNILKGKEGGIKINLDYNIDGAASDFKIDGDLNKLTEATRKALLGWAGSISDSNLLDSARTSKTPLNPGGGTIAPGSVSSEEWRRDVYNAVNKCLGFKYRELMQLESNEVDSLFNKY